MNPEKPVIIPRDVPHALELTENFEAFGVSPLAGKVEFD
jgi:hypothetical protein